MLGISPDQHNVAFATEEEEVWLSRCSSVNILTEANQQKRWYVPLVQQSFEKLLDQNSISDRDRARLLAVSQKESGHWLHAIPSSNIGTLLDDHSFRIAIGLRLGPICHIHQCHCGVEVDRLGHHGLSCLRSAGRLSRHGSLNETIKRALASIRVPSVLEPNGLVRTDGKRPDGLTLIPWERGRALIWDATCVDTLAPSHIRGSAFKAGSAAEAAESAKRRKYEVLCQSYVFAPFAVETLGPWGPSLKNFLNKISPRLCAASGDVRAGSFLAQRIAIAIQRGNAASILGTMPHCEGLVDL